MPKLYTTEQFWQTYQTLPKQIQDALWEPKTGETIADVIEKNGLGQYHNEIVDLCGAVFLGILVPQELQAELEKLGAPADAAKLAAQQLQGLIFYPIKPGLEQLHRQVGAKESTSQKLDMAVPRHSEQNGYIAENPAEPAQTPETTELTTKQPEPKQKGDVYREPLE